MRLKNPRSLFEVLIAIGFFLYGAHDLLNTPSQGLDIAHGTEIALLFLMKILFFLAIPILTFLKILRWMGWISIQEAMGRIFFKRSFLKILWLGS